MFSKQEASLLRQQFWTSFGQYMAPVPAADGKKINWVNYKTGVKDLYFKMEAGNDMATISIVVTHADAGKQYRVFDQLLQLKNMLKDALQEEWNWQLQSPDAYNKIVSSVTGTLKNVSIFKKQDWPAIISFFKTRIIALDGFWTEVKDGFDAI
ncbi:MAG: DUF4268 domain-containing protein [Chitinophagaceae bacterium]